MVKQVKVKSTLKVSRSGNVLPSIVCWQGFPLTGTSEHIPSLWRRMDVHNQERTVQDGVERNCPNTEDQNCSMQERWRYWVGQEINFHTKAVNGSHIRLASNLTTHQYLAKPVLFILDFVERMYVRGVVLVLFCFRVSLIYGLYLNLPV